MKIGILKENDRVLNVTKDFVAIERKNHEVDIIPLIFDNTGLRVDIENITTIGFGDNIIQTESIDGVTITNF